jgi:hypothetical protein
VLEKERNDARALTHRLVLDVVPDGCEHGGEHNHDKEGGELHQTHLRLHSHRLRVRACCFAFVQPELSVVEEVRKRVKRVEGVMDEVV